MAVVPAIRPRVGSRWQSLEAWAGTRNSAVALFVLALAVFALQSVVLPVQPGRDLGRYVQTYVQLGYEEPVLPSVLNTRGPLAALGSALPLELGATAAELWLAVLFAASILAWAAIASLLGPRAAIATAAVLLVYPGYGILFHGLAGDALFAAAFAGWALVLARAILAPSVTTFLLAGAMTGVLVLVRPPNEMLVVFALLPLVLRAPWDRRLAWAASFFVAAVAVAQSWKAVATLRYGDAVALRPSAALLGVAFLLVPLIAPAVWRRRLALLAIPVVVAALAVQTSDLGALGDRVRTAMDPPLNVFLFRAFVMDRIVAPDNGPASRQLAAVAQRDLLAEEPYRSYGVDLNEFFSSGSERIFEDLESLAGSADLEAVAREAIEQHPQTFAAGVARTFWDLVWTTRIYASAPAAADGGGGDGGDDDDAVVVDGRRLPRPSGDEPIPASRVGPDVRTLGGGAREVWQSPTDHPLVFDDPRDERRYERFERDSGRLSSRIPARDGSAGLIHRLNQASRAFPPPVVWLAVGLVALAVRRPRRALVAVAPAAAAVMVLGVTALVALPVAEYAGPVSPAFVLLAAAGLLGADPRRAFSRPTWFRRRRGSGTGAAPGPTARSDSRPAG